MTQPTKATAIQGQLARLGSAILFAASTALLPVGVLMPTIRIEVTDPVTKLLGIPFPEYRPKQDELSIVGVIFELWKGGDRFLAAIIFVFSIVFPVAKLIVMWAGAVNMWVGKNSAILRRALWFSDKLGKWSLLDVLVIAIAVVTLKQFPGGVQVSLGSGVWLFGASILLAMLGGIMLHHWYSHGYGHGTGQAEQAAAG